MKRMQAILAAALVLTLFAAPSAFAFGEATFGAQNWWQTERAAKLQEFREWPNGAYLESFLVRGQVGSFAATGWGSDLFLKQQAMGLSFDHGIRWQLDGSYQQTPHLFSLIARSPFTYLGNGVFALSDSLQRQNQDNAAGFINRMNAEMAVAPGVALEHRTDVSDARLRFRPTRGWQLELKGERRARTGTKAFATSFGFSNSNEVMEPIEQRMSDVAAIANYSREHVGFRALVGYSKFDNKVDALIVDNPRRGTDSPTAGSSRGRLDLYPDNHAVRGQVDLNLRLPSRTQFSGTWALARHRQDDPWLPFTINSAFSQATLDSLYGGTAARSTDGRALRFTQNYRLSRRVSDAVKGNVHFRQQHYTNQTEEFPFRGVVQYDQSLVRDTVGFINRPFGNQQLTLGTDWDARVADGVNVTAGYDRRWREHTHREVENDHEDELRARLYAGVGGEVTISGGYTYGARRLDEFNLADYRRADAPDTVYLENPGLRRFDVADRNRHMAEMELGWSPTERVDLGVSGDYQRSKFDQSQFGLQDEERWTLLGEVTFTPMDTWDLGGGYGYGRIDSDQASQERGATEIPIRDGNLTSGNDWTARIRDRNDYGFVQSTWKIVPKTVALTLGYWVSRDQAAFFLDNETGAAVDLPDTYSLRQEGRLELRYRLPDGTEILGRYGYDAIKVNDFAAKDIPLLGVAGTPPGATAIYLGAGLQDVTAHSLAIAFSRKF